MTPIDLIKRMLPYCEARRDYLRGHLASYPKTPQRASNERELDTLTTLCADARRELRKARKEGSND